MGLFGIGAIAGAKTLGKVVLGGAGSIGFSLVAVAAGIWLGLRKQLEGAINEQERRGLIRSAGINVMASVLFVVCMLAAGISERGGWQVPLLAMLTFMAVIFYQTIVVQPRVMARRHALEAQRDPAGAARMHRRERIQSWIGAGIGVSCGLGGMIAGLVASGRL